jgi:adenylate cyclase
LLLGLSIPLWLASHFGAQRVSGWLYDLPPSTYANPLFGYWVLRQHMIAVQMILMTVAWTHACIGLYFWLRMKPFFRWAAPILLSIAVLLPPLAMLGAHQGAQDVIRRAKDPVWRAQNITPIPRDKRSDTRPRFCWYSGPAACARSTSAGAACLRSRIRGARCASRKG